MKYELQEYHRNISVKEIIEDLQDIAKRLKKESVSNMDYSVYGKYHASTVKEKFGTWNNALKKAGLKVGKFQKIDDEELLYNLKHVWDSLGRQPRYFEMIKPLSKYPPGTYAAHFGSWSDALKLFVKSANKGNLPVRPIKRSVRPVEVLKMMNRKRSRKTITKGLRYDVLVRDHFRCKLCGVTPMDNPKIKLHVDHIIPLSKGGDTIAANLQILCSECNLGKAAKTVKSKKAKVKNKIKSF